MEPFNAYTVQFKAKLDGAQAYKDDKPCSACPFKRGYRKEAWERGWWSERIKDGAPNGIVKGSK